MKKLLAIGLAAALLLLAAAPPARAENGRHAAFALGAGAGVLGTLLLGSILAPRPAVAVPAPVYAPPPPVVYRYYVPPPVVYYPAPAYYVAPPAPPPTYYYYSTPR
jgi:hypothetical protein